jgi:hypothetical protein
MGGACETRFRHHHQEETHVAALIGNTPDRPDPAHTARVREWVESAIGAPDSTVISVSQLSCREPGCQPLETCITVFAEGAPAWSVTIHLPVADLTHDLVRQAVLRH